MPIARPGAVRLSPAGERLDWSYSVPIPPSEVCSDSQGLAWPGSAIGHFYARGVFGARPTIPTSWPDLDRLAAAGCRVTATDTWPGAPAPSRRCGPTGRAFERRQLVPRMLRDVSVRDTAVELFGRRLPAPLLLAPIGALGILHREADVAVAKAAAEHGVPFIFSNQASRPMEDCAAAMGRARGGSSCTGPPPTTWWPAWSGGPRRRVARPSWSPWTPPCWAGGPGIWIRATCRLRWATGSPSTPATRFSARWRRRGSSSDRRPATAAESLRWSGPWPGCRAMPRDGRSANLPSPGRPCRPSWRPIRGPR